MAFVITIDKNLYWANAANRTKNWRWTDSVSCAETWNTEEAAQSVIVFWLRGQSTLNGPDLRKAKVIKMEGKSSPA